MYKMIVVDLDGTLLNDYKEISTEDAEILKRAYNEKGIITVIATGRPLKYAQRLCLENEEFASHIVSCNGTIIYDMGTNEYINKEFFSKQEILDIRNVFLEEKADYLMIFAEQNLITEISGTKESETLKVVVDENKIKFRNIEEWVKEEPNTEIYTCVIGQMGELEGNLQRAKSKLDQIPGIQAFEISKYLHKVGEETLIAMCADISKAGCTKKSGVYKLAKKLNIKQEEIIVIGDGGNDLPMFDVAGLKIAMANAEDYIKEKADFVTTSNNESGVANAIKKVIFDEK